MQQELYAVWLKNSSGITIPRYQALCAAFGSPAGVFNAVRQGGIHPEKFPFAQSLMAREQQLELAARLLEVPDMHVVLENSSEYPAGLREIFQPPPVLYVRGKGSLKDLEKALAVVGSRKCTAYGARTAYAFSRELAEQGVCVVSGMALGIDGAAHEGALAACGKSPLPTVAVLACGVDKAYPARHQGLFEQILDSGLAVSENPPKTPYYNGSFPLRNRIIAGLSRGVLVVEASLKSGVSHTLNYALDAGREIFAIPGRIGEEQSVGTLEMIKSGAFAVTGSEEILEAMGWQRRKMFQKPEAELSQEEQRILELLEEKELSADQLCEKSGIPIHRLLALLTRLECKELIFRTPSKGYSRC